MMSYTPVAMLIPRTLHVRRALASLSGFLRPRQAWSRLVCLAFVLWLVPGVLLAQVAPGLYYDRTRSGHGLDLQRSGATLFGTFFTYDAQGEPTWYFLQTSNSVPVRGELLRVSKRPGAAASLQKMGEFSLVPVDSCPDGVARPETRVLLRFEFQLPDGNAPFCLEPLLPAAQLPMTSLNGARYQLGDSGWGLLSFYFPDTNGVTQTFKSLYYHDRSGFPRWAFAAGTAPRFSLNLALRALRAPCRFCTVDASTASNVGTLDVSIVSNQNVPANRAKLDVRDAQGSVFARDTALTLLSEPLLVIGTASTREGLIHGEVLEGVQVFRRVPYAASPIGDLRLRAPRSASARDEVLSTQRFGDGCMQPAPVGAFANAVPSMSEDCLQLNVWRPNKPGPHPVMVWIHGGGLTQGSAIERSVSGRLVYDGEGFARRDVVLVTINYRLGPFGFAAHRQLSSESGTSSAPGNYGLLDQIAALRWVRDNIAEFGGDPENITIFGESAGGVSTCALMSTPAAHGLFQRAIMQSGNCRIGLPNREQALAQGDRLVSAYGCASVADIPACLRTLPASLLLQRAEPTIALFGSSGGENFGLHVDGQLLVEQPGDAVASGRAAKVPLIIGINDDETTTLAPESVLPGTVPTYEASVRAMFGLATGNRIVSVYPADAYPSPQAAYQDLLDDVQFTCPNRRAAADHSAAGNAVFKYVLTEILPDPQLRPFQSFHGLDVVLLFGPRPNAQPSEVQVAEQMQSAWVAFARNGNPGSAASIEWPRYGPNSRALLQFEGRGNTQRVNDYRQAFCEFWATVTRL